MTSLPTSPVAAEPRVTTAPAATAESRPRRRVSRLLRILAEELTPPHARFWWANLLGRLLPVGAAGRLRARLYPILGAARVAPETMIYGPVTFAAARGVVPDIRIGRRCFLNAHVYLDATAPILLGDGVSLGHHVSIVTTGHDIGTPAFRAADLRPAPVHIGDGAWIAAGVLILPGVTVGPGAVVAAGAVVTRDVPPNTLVGGVPARVLRNLPVDTAI